MRITNEQEKREALTKLLMELAESQDILKERKQRSEIYVQLENIYYNPNGDNFRHFYSDIFSTLSLIDSNPESGNLDILAQNMQAIKDGYEVKNKDDNDQWIDIRMEIIKLYDHASLDIARINYTKTITEDTQSELAKNKQQLLQLQSKTDESVEILHKESKNILEKMNSMSDDIKNNQSDMQKEYITILGIFAAIVLAFTGGMTFSGSVLENISNASIYRICIVTLIVGLILLNLIWILLDFMCEINGKMIRRKFLFAFVNIVLILGILGTCISYKYGIFDKKNTLVDKVIEENEIEETKTVQ